MTRLALAAGEDQAVCLDAGALCRAVYRLTSNADLSVNAGLFLGRPVKIVLILVLAVVVRALVHRAVGRLVRRASAELPALLPHRAREAVRAASPLLAERRQQRAETVGSVLRNASSAAVFTVAVFMVLAELGFALGPVLASAGIVGVALGFGAQNLVKDVLSGVFIILEDQYGVGDVVDLGEASGSVEGVGLRTTRLRAVDGTVWYVRNGEILRVGNKSQGWARALLDVAVAHGTDLPLARRVILEVAQSVAADEAYADVVLEPPEVWGVELLADTGPVVRLVVKTAPLEQWRVARELRERLAGRLRAEGIEVPDPRRTVVVSDPGTPATTAAAAAAADAGGPASA